MEFVINYVPRELTFRKPPSIPNGNVKKNILHYIYRESIDLLSSL